MKNPMQQTNIVEPSFFSNWADLFMPPLANKLFLPLALKINWLTPNIVTIFSFFLYVLGCLFLFVIFPYHLLFAATLIPIAYLLDCLDGQLARTKKQFSTVGDYLDKTLDVLKIYIVTLSLALALYQTTQNALWFVLGMTACFFFNYRYYLKLETVLTATGRDATYLEKCSSYRKEQYVILRQKYAEMKKTPVGFIKNLWMRNRIVFFIDEAEFVLITSIGALFNRLDLALIILAVSQLWIAIFRLFERGYQIKTNSPSLIKPMRK